MSRDLAAEIACFLSEWGPASAELIARSIRARTVDVRRVLRDDGRFQRLAPQKAWICLPSVLVASEAAGRAGTGTHTQCARLLAVLSDGRPHRSVDLYRMGLGVVHSRVSNLRERGYEISCWLEVGPRNERTYWYRLARKPEEAAA